VARSVKKSFLRDEPQGFTPGNLFEPPAGWSSASGGFNRETGRWAVRKARRAAAYALGAGLLAWLLTRAAKTGKRG
jgi:hypothetical protein